MERYTIWIFFQTWGFVLQWFLKHWVKLKNSSRWAIRVEFLCQSNLSVTYIEKDNYFSRSDFSWLSFSLYTNANVCMERYTIWRFFQTCGFVLQWFLKHWVKLKNSSCWSEESYDLNFYVNPIWQLHRKRYWDNNAEFEIDYNSWLWLMIYKIFILHAWRLGVEIIFASQKQVKILVHSFLLWYDCWPNDVK